MSVTSTTYQTSATGNGVATKFPFTFAIRTTSEIAVYVNGTQIFSGFGVVLNSSLNGGTVTFATPPANNAPILMAAVPSFLQPVTFLNAGSYNAKTVDGAFDEAAIRDIYLLGEINRSLRVPLGETAIVLPSKTDRANKALSFDANGNPGVSAAAKGDPGSPGEGYATRTAMAARAGPAVADDVYLTEAGRFGKFVVDLASNWTAAIAADTAQGLFVASTSDATKVYVRADIWKHFWDIRWFGAIANDQANAGTDALAAINAMLAVAAVVGNMRSNDATFNGLIGCDFPGYYFCSAFINLKTPMHLRGLSGGMGGVVGGSRIRFPAGVAGIVVNRSDSDGYTVNAVAATTGADGSIIEGLPLFCGTGVRPAAGTTHGILVRARCTIENCYITGFAGTGIAVYADISSSVPMYGNADGYHVRGGRVQNCGVHGFHAKGDNSNAGEVIGLDTFGNGQWGFLDETFLGVSRIGGQDAGNGGAAYVNYPANGQVYAAVFGQETGASTTQPGTNSNIWWPVGTLTGGGYPTWTSGMTVVSGGPMALRSTSVALAPYAEGGQGPWQIGTSSLIIGGLPGPNVDTLGPRLYANLGQIEFIGGFRADARSWFEKEIFFDGNFSTNWPGALGGQFAAAMYWNSSDGFVAYGSGSAYDFNILNKAGTRVISIPTGQTQVNFGGNIKVGGNVLANNGNVVVDSVGSVTVGGGTTLTKVVVYTPTLTPASVAAATVAEQTFTVTGLTTADKVIVNPPALGNATGIAGVRVSAANTLAIRFVNPTAGALTPGSGVFTVIAIRS